MQFDQARVVDTAAEQAVEQFEGRRFDHAGTLLGVSVATTMTLAEGGDLAEAEVWHPRPLDDHDRDLS